MSATRAARRSSHSHPRRMGRSGSSRLKALDHDPPMGSSSLLAHDQLAMRWARGAEDVDASRQQRRIVANHDEDAIEDGADRVCSGSRGSEAWVRPWMPEIDDDGVTGKASSAGAIERRQSPISRP